MGTSKNGSLRHVFNANVGGNYRVTLRYMNTDKNGNLKLNVNGTEKKVGCSVTGNNNWSTVSLGFQFNKGANTLTIDNISGTNLCLDQVVFEPTTEQVKDDVAFEDEPDEPITPSDPAYPYVVLKDNFAQEGGGKVPQGWVMADLVSFNSRKAVRLLMDCMCARRPPMTVMVFMAQCRAIKCL